MYQDIPKSFDIEFDDTPIKADDRLLCYDKETVLCRIENGRAIYPRLCDFDKKPKSVFAFSVDKKRYFLCLEKCEAEGFEYIDINRLKTAADTGEKFAGITGWQYYAFHEENKFCSKCGSRLFHDPKKRCMICGSCKNEVFPKIAPAIIVGVVDTENDSILLTKYADRDYKKYALVAGFCEMGESAEQTVVREVMEETGVEVEDITYYKSQPWGYAQNLLVGFFAKVKGSRKITMDETELSQALWVKRSDVPEPETLISLTSEMMRTYKNGGIIWHN